MLPGSFFPFFPIYQALSHHTQAERKLIRWAFKAELWNRRLGLRSRVLYGVWFSYWSTLNDGGFGEIMTYRCFIVGHCWLFIIWPEPLSFFNFRYYTKLFFQQVSPIVLLILFIINSSLENSQTVLHMKLFNQFTIINTYNDKNKTGSLITV